MTETPDLLDEAETAYRDALLERTRASAPHRWADTTGGLGELELDRHRFDNDPAHLSNARRFIEAAREVMAEGDEFLTARCDALLARIEAAERGN